MIRARRPTRSYRISGLLPEAARRWEIDVVLVGGWTVGEESVEVRSLALEDTCSTDMLVLIRRQSPKHGRPAPQLPAINSDEDWHYWVAQSYCF
jgi:hypothetical protein